jgi:hypothetical protein
MCTSSGPAGEAIFRLNCPQGPPTLRESIGFKVAELNRLKASLMAELGRLCSEWERIHGHH